MMFKLYSILFLLALPCWLAAQNVEICGDGIDNDFDGAIDEVCQPFECDGSLYQSARENGDFILFKVNANPVQFIQISNLTQNGVQGSFNSLAYNPLDNFMYGMGTNDAKLYRIDATGAVEFMGNVSGLSAFKNAGTFDASGNFYVYGDNILRKIDINNLTYQQIGGTGQYGSADIVFNPIDQLIYGWSGSPKLLFSIDPNTGAQTRIPGNAPLAINSWGWTGALYFNAQGSILGYQGTRMIKIDPTTGIGLLAGSGPNKSSNDGCSCSFGVEMTKSVTGNFGAGDTITYHFQFFNQSFTAINDPLQFGDLLTGGFTWVSDPYNLNNISLSGNTNLVGTDNAQFTVDGLPQGKASFSIDVLVPCGYASSNYTNQATLSNLPAPLKDSIWSDNPNTITIGDPTTFTLTNAPLVLNTTVDNIICERTTGTIHLQASGGEQPLSYLWDNGQNTAIATGLAVGNYTVTITGATGCTATSTATVIEEQISLTSNISPQDVQCNGESNGSVQIDSSFGGYAPYRYSLDGSNYNTNTLFSDLAEGNYTLYTKDQFGCEGQTSFVLIEPIFRLDIQAPSDTAVLLGDLVAGNILQNTLTPVSYQWTPNIGLNCDDCQDPIIQALATTTYTIKGMDVRGCFDSTTFTIEVNEDTRVFIPNAFSPNDDGSNDILVIYSPGDVRNVKSFQIFDRWGELVFFRENFQPNLTANGWDGRFQGQALNTGVFVYVAELELVDGRTEVVTGDITLLR